MLIHELVKSFSRHHRLIVQLARRNIISRYRGSVAGMAWSMLIPILMLAVYTFVFGYIFGLRSGSADAEVGPDLGFAAFLFSGIVVHAFFAECLNRAPGLISNNAQYVKKVVFPLECLGWVAILTALFQTTISLTVLLIFLWFLNGVVHPTVFLVPVIFLPLALLASGIIWFLSAVTVFVKDFAQIVGVLVTLMLFLSPVFYPVSVLPPLMQKLIYLNPISFIIEQLRRVVLEGMWPAWTGLSVYFLVACVVALLGLMFFRRLRPAFADVL